MSCHEISSGRSTIPWALSGITRCRVVGSKSFNRRMSPAVFSDDNKVESLGPSISSYPFESWVGFSLFVAIDRSRSNRHSAESAISIRALKLGSKSANLVSANSYAKNIEFALTVTSGGHFY